MENLGFGLTLTVLGMGLVFTLLALLWGVLSLLVRLDRPPATPTAEIEEALSAQPSAPAVTDQLDPDLIAAVTMAVLTHRAVRRKQAAPAMRSYWPGSLIYASRWVASGRARQQQNWQRRG